MKQKAINTSALDASGKVAHRTILPIEKIGQNKKSL